MIDRPVSELDGPSRTIRIEPLEVPQPIELPEEPAPEKAPTEAPQEPVPA